MSSEDDSQKTEQPTNHKLEEARDKGQVAIGKDVAQTFSFLVTIAIFCFAGYTGAEYAMETIRESLKFYEHDFTALSTTMVKEFWDSQILAFFVFNVPVMATIIVVIIVQIGFHFTAEPIMPKLEKISLIKGFERIFSKKNFFEFAMTLIKAIAVGWVVWYFFKYSLPSFVNAPQCAYVCSIQIFAKAILYIACYSLLVMAVFSIFDYISHKHFHIKELMMSRHEIKEEYKKLEGNMEMKQERKRTHRDMVENGGGSAKKKVQNSNVIVTNPTHYAIGIYFSRADEQLPKIIIKAADERAIKIKRLAADEGVTIIEDIQLARSLYAVHEEGDFISKKFFEPVAAILKTADKMNRAKKVRDLNSKK